MAQEIKKATLTWVDGLLFDGALAGSPVVRIDADNVTAPGTMGLLLLAAASCTASDVVLILEKMRVALERLSVDVSGTRRETDPRRYMALHFVYHLRGRELDEAKARRAIDLSIEKYCSVMHSLAADIVVTYDLDLS
jgi:putative redox protein